VNHNGIRHEIPGATTALALWRSHTSRNGTPGKALGKHLENPKKKQQNGRKKTMKITSKSWETMTLLDNLKKILIISVQHSSRKVMTDIV
jgi:hypothetical protein